MLLAWLLPDASDGVLDDSWTRSSYQPRHSKPPVIVRAGQGAAVTVSALRQRYLGPAAPSLPPEVHEHAAEVL
jgi:hypothetical protein